VSAVHFRGGRRPPYPEHVKPRLKLGPYLRAAELPPVPPVVDYMSKVADWPVYLNTDIGDCTMAAAGHMIEAWTAYGQGETVKVTDADVLKAYEDVSGYQPDDPATDQGAIMQDCLNYFRKVGVGGHTIVAFAELNVADQQEIRAALHLFGHVYVGANVPYSALYQFDQGKPWDVVRRSPIAGGHAVNVGYAADGHNLRCVTWGAVQELTARWWDAYVEEAWVAVSGEWLSAAGASPPGLDLAQLGEAFTSLTGEPFPLIPPDPGPPAPPPSAGPADVQLAAAVRAWLAAKNL